MKLLNWVLKTFFTKDTETQSHRRQVKDVKAGEIIQIEWNRIHGGIGGIKCINNDPQTKKILLEVTWSNYEELGVEEKERLILGYNSKHLENFHLLNQIREDDDDEENDFDIATLQNKMNEAIEKEEYEKADKLQKKIDNLLKK